MIDKFINSIFNYYESFCTEFSLPFMLLPFIIILVFSYNDILKIKSYRTKGYIDKKNIIKAIILTPILFVLLILEIFNVLKFN